MAKETPEKIAVSNAKTLFLTRYHGAEFCIASGSIIQGHGVAHSDLDLIVVFPKLPEAYRESFFIQDMPVEAFVHDYETIQAFMDDDYKRGNASMQHMIVTGVIIPYEIEIALKLKSYAQQIIKSGLQSSSEKIEALRYTVSDLIDDLKDKRPTNEVRSILYVLYSSIGELRLRLAGEFFGSGKHLARKLKQCDPLLSQNLETIMVKAHADKLVAQDIEILLSIGQSLGGYLFDGYKQSASSEMRVQAKWFMPPSTSSS
jgi:hypothetical protein